MSAGPPLSGENEPMPGHVDPTCDGDGCYCPDDVFWGRLLGDDDPCAPGKDWAAAAFGDGRCRHGVPLVSRPSGTSTYCERCASALAANPRYYVDNLHLPSGAQS